MHSAIKGFGTDSERAQRRLEALEWAVENVPTGQKAAAATRARRGEAVRHRQGVVREVRFLPLDDPCNFPIVVRVETVNVAEALSAFMLDRYPELWPGAATFPVHDPPAQ
jgi:hypothetical protein